MRIVLTLDMRGEDREARPAVADAEAATRLREKVLAAAERGVENLGASSPAHLLAALRVLAELGL
jgi:hypothetical protein